jgi:hypothetical protein
MKTKTSFTVCDHQISFKGRSSYLFGREFYTGSKREFILVWRRVLHRLNKYELLSLNLYKTLLQTSMNPYLRTCVKLSSKQV